MANCRLLAVFPSALYISGKRIQFPFQVHLYGCDGPQGDFGPRRQQSRWPRLLWKQTVGAGRTGEIPWCISFHILNGGSTCAFVAWLTDLEKRASLQVCPLSSLCGNKPSIHDHFPPNLFSVHLKIITIMLSLMFFVTFADKFLIYCTKFWLRSYSKMPELYKDW